MPKKRAPEHENHDRWLISYADFITLLFAFFVVMFASSKVDQKKTAAFSQSVATALESGAAAAGQRYVPRGVEPARGRGGNLPPTGRPESAEAAAAELMPSMR